MADQSPFIGVGCKLIIRDRRDAIIADQSLFIGVVCKLII